MCVGGGGAGERQGFHEEGGGGNFEEFNAALQNVSTGHALYLFPFRLRNVI